MASFIETARAYHEDIEQYEDACTKILMEEARTHRENLVQSFRVNVFVEKILERHRRLAEIYRDEDGTMKEEIESITGDPSSTQLYAQFYNKLQEVKEYHRRFVRLETQPHEAVLMTSEKAAEEAKCKALAPFNNEEGSGRYVDLHDVHFRFSNLDGVRGSGYAINYMTYLSHLSDHGFVRVPAETRRRPEYLEYLRSLSGYLVSFLGRVNPLLDLQSRLKEAHDRFDRTWQDRSFRFMGSDMTVGGKGAPEQGAPVESGDDPDWVLPWRLDLERSATRYCPCCQKQFVKESVWRSHLGSPRHRRSYEKYVAHVKEVSLVESEVFEVSELLQDVFVATRENIEKKQARLPSEAGSYMDEEDDADPDLDDVEQDPHRIRLTKKNYPVGPDGNPLPYWLYKLQGLSHEFVCQICGNTSYFGRRAFERHFSDYRHTYGLKCLGLENSKDMFEITRIKDALELGKRLDVLKQKNKWNPETMEEFEDADGTILDKQTYELLSKQFGLS